MVSLDAQLSNPHLTDSPTSINTRATFGPYACATGVVQITQRSQTALFEDGDVRPGEPNRALTRSRKPARDAETFGSNVRPFAERRLMAGRATVGKRDNDLAEGA